MIDPSTLDDIAYLAHWFNEVDVKDGMKKHGYDTIGHVLEAISDVEGRYHMWRETLSDLRVMLTEMDVNE